LIGPLKETKAGNVFVLTLTDYFSKWVDFYPIPRKTAENVSSRIELFIYAFGAPKRFITDQGREFVNSLNRQLFESFGIRHSISAAYHPQTNGLSERTNRTLKERLSTLVNEEMDDWDLLLPKVAHSMRTVRQTTTKMSPYEILFGRKPNTKIEIETTDFDGSGFHEPSCFDFDQQVEEQASCFEKINTEALTNIERAQMRQCKNYMDRISKGSRSFLFHVGDVVLKRNMKNINRKGGKMDKTWLGPYIITRMNGKRIFLKKKA